MMFNYFILNNSILQFDLTVSVKESKSKTLIWLLIILIKGCIISHLCTAIPVLKVFFLHILKVIYHVEYEEPCIGLPR